MHSLVTLRLPALPSAVTREDRTSLPDLPSSAETSDEVLVSRICDHDSDALAVLFRRYAGLVRGLAYRVLRNPAEADDLLQDIFLLVHRLCRTFDGSKGSARFWILQMTYRRAISRRRYLTSRHFYTHLDLEQAANRLGDPECGFAGPEASLNDSLDRREILQFSFTELSEGQRQTLNLFFFEGYTFEEIAAKLGQTVGNARNHYYRGLEKLRKQISGAIAGQRSSMIQDLSRRSGYVVAKRTP